MKKSIWAGYEVTNTGSDIYSTRPYFDLDSVKREIRDRHNHLTDREKSRVEGYYAERYDIEVPDSDGRTADELFETCFDIPSVEVINWREPDGLIEVTLSNDSRIFDSAHGFRCIEDALDFAAGRGGKYNVHIARTGEIGISLSYDSASRVYSHYDGRTWTRIPEDELVEYIERYV